MSAAIPPAAETTGAMARAGRDPLLDLWRGLALLDMVLVHLAWNGIGLPEPFDTLVKHYTRFAAGGFVLIAGLTVGTVFGPRTRGSSEERRASYRWLWRRALLLVVIDRAASVAMCVVERARPFSGEGGAGSWLDVLCFRVPGTTGGLLALYTLLLGLSPLLFGLVRRVGPVAVLAASLAAYAAVDRVGGAWHWPPWTFPLASWQPIYVIGLVSVPLVAWIRAGGTRRIGVWLAISIASFAPIFVARFGADFGFAGLAERVALDFTKVPLRPGALLWYVLATQLVCAGSLAVWEGLPATRRWASWLVTLGRNSLAVYVAHLFTEVPVVDWIWGTWPPASLRTFLVCLDVGVLVGLAYWIETGRGAAPRPSGFGRPPRWIPRPAWGVGVAIAGATMMLGAVRVAVATASSVAAQPLPELGGEPQLVEQVVHSVTEQRAGEAGPMAFENPNPAAPI